MSRSHYEVLGLEKSCTMEDIKKAYRKLARELHPDRSTDKDANTKFQELSEAYEVLSNPQKRKAYDFQQSGGFGKSSGPRIFRFSSTTTGANSSGAGIDPSVFIRNMFVGGFGQDPADPPSKQVKCSLGDVSIGKKHLVKARNGKMVVIDIPKGCPEGKKITSHGQVWEIITKPHPVYTRNGTDLHMNHKLSLKELVEGFIIIIEMLDGKKKKITHKYGGTTTEIDKLVLNLPHMGLPDMSGGTGSIIVHFTVDLPITI